MTKYPSKWFSKPSEKEAFLHLLAAEKIARSENDNFLKHHAKSVELIKINAQRGMSRNAMRKIWSDRLINLVLGYEETK